MGAMTKEAWILLGLVWGLIAFSTLYCFWKLLTSERRLGESEPPAEPR